MTDSASITVTNHRLRKAMSNANDDDLKSHTKKMGDKIKSELTLHLGEILKIYPYRDKCEVKIKGTSETETCLIAHDILSEGMNVSGFPTGHVAHEKSEEVIIPSETVYGIILDVDIGGKNQKCVVSYINLDRKHTPNNAKNGEYKIQVGKNVISLTDKYININSDNLFINGLPYTEAYKPLDDYHDKEEIGNIVTEIDNANTDLQNQINDIVNVIYPIGSIYMSMNSTSPSILFGGKWERISQGRTLIGEGIWTDSNNETKTFSNGTTGGEYSHTLTRNEIPKHYHPYTTAPHLFAERDTSASQIISPSSGASKSVKKNTDYQYTEGDTDKPHNNIQPYLVVYIWKRVE